jgi:hypothetical protein
MGKTKKKPAVNKTDPYARRWWRGVQLDNRTISAIEWAEARYLRNQKTGKKRGKGRKAWVMTQGSYNAGGVAASAGTHDGGGVYDGSIRGLGDKQIKAMVKWLRKAGFAAWHRQGPGWVGNEHVHAVLLGHRKASRGAKDQMVQYRQHRNGLANHGWDDAWRPEPKLPRWSHRQNKPFPKYEQA